MYPAEYDNAVGREERIWPAPQSPHRAEYDFRIQKLGQSMSKSKHAAALLLYVRFADPSDTTPITAQVDGKPVKLIPAYTSTRAVPECFVGYYADLSGIEADVRHTIQLRAIGLAQGQLQGVFFYNVPPQYVESIER